jgi:hypothetical protein
MKTCIIMVLSSTEEQYEKLHQTSKQTWDSIEEPGTETIYYFGESNKLNTDKEFYFPIKEHLYNIGYKNLLAFEWALKNKTWDYMVRINASTYVHKKRLLGYIQTLPNSNLFAGLTVSGPPRYLWGPYIIMSRDVIQQFLNYQNLWNHNVIEDQAMGYLADSLYIPYYGLRACSIDKRNHGWQCNSDTTHSYAFTNFETVSKDYWNFLFRCKTQIKSLYENAHYDRGDDHYAMQQLCKYLPKE